MSSTFVSFVLQLIGLRWFIKRTPLRHKWPFAAVALALAAYTAMFLLKIPYGGNILNITNITVCAASAWMLFRNASLPVSRVSAVVLIS